MGHSEEPAPDIGAVGVPVPTAHVGAFVAEVFEDPERDTGWEEAVDALVAPSARGAWNELEPKAQVRAVVAKADSFDQRAVDRLAGLDLDGEPQAVRAPFEEARRLRRNADMLRDAVADAFASGHVSDTELLAAVEDHGFDTTLVAERERHLERVADAHGFDFRPYGGTLFHAAGDADCPTPVDW